MHYPEEFYTGLLNNQPMGFYSAATLIQDAKRRGLRFDAACVAHSEWLAQIPCTGRIRLGLRMVKGVAKSSILKCCRRDRKKHLPAFSIFAEERISTQKSYACSPKQEL